MVFLIQEITAITPLALSERVTFRLLKIATIYVAQSKLSVETYLKVIDFVATFESDRLLLQETDNQKW
jgi:hypothetical protein